MMAFISKMNKFSQLQLLQTLPKVLGRRNASLLSMKPRVFADYMKENGLRRCTVVYDEKKSESVVSSEKLKDLQDFCNVETNPDYLKHEGLFLEIGKRSDALLGAFIWRTNRGQACGGVRLLEYSSMSDYLLDGLRLSQGMGLKSALAGLWSGGGKGVIASPGKDAVKDPVLRRNIFLDYGDFLTSLNGCHVGAEDVGVVVSDLDTVSEQTRFITCISESKGGSGNPSLATGKGIVCAMEAVLDFLGKGSIEGKTVVSQGSGNVAKVMIETLLDKNIGHIHAIDINEDQLKLTETMMAGKNGGRLTLEHVPEGDTRAFAMPCDIFSPNALGGIINADTIPLIKSKIVCGAANNQLSRLSDNELLEERGITYVVDFLCNRMGIVNCANETYGRLHNDPALLQHFDKEWQHSIWNVTHQVLTEAKVKGITPVNAAIEIADRESKVFHPIWKDRSKKIIEGLISDKWASQK